MFFCFVLLLWILWHTTLFTERRILHVLWLTLDLFNFKSNIVWRWWQYLYPCVAVVGRHDPVLGEDEVDGAAGLPALHVDGDAGVGLGVPLGDLLEPVQHVPCNSSGHPSMDFFLLLFFLYIFTTY